MGNSARALLTAACLLTVACNGDNGGPASPSLDTTSNVSVAYPEDHGTIYIGDGVQFRATLSSSAGGTQAASNAAWESDAPTVASVSPSGLVTAVSAGESDDSPPRSRAVGAARCASASSRSSTDTGRAT